MNSCTLSSGERAGVRAYHTENASDIPLAATIHRVRD